jgi:osmotically-inducible protein OsmY
MNKYFKRLTIIFLAVSLALVGACASTENQEGLGEYVDDSVITTRVKAAIFKEKLLSVADINVETFKGVVQLSGFVNSHYEETLAVTVAKGVSGVKSVTDAMQLK